MTVQQYCQQYFGMTADDYTELIMCMRLATDDDYLSWSCTQTLTQEMADRLKPVPTVKQIYHDARHGWRNIMYHADREIYHY